ncbi:MAG: cytochrome c-type biogenesis protein [Pseudomonadota bacterium]
MTHIIERRYAPAKAGAQDSKHRRLPLWIRTFAGVLACVSLAILSSPLHAQSRMPDAEWANRQLPDPQQEAEAAALMESLRCLVCQGQSIADSDADMAQDMRALVRRRIAAGEEPEDIRNWLVDRYGRWITYNPPIDSVTWPLWLLPILLVGAGIWLARGRFRSRKKES